MCGIILRHYLKCKHMRSNKLACAFMNSEWLCLANMFTSYCEFNDICPQCLCWASPRELDELEANDMGQSHWKSWGVGGHPEWEAYRPLAVPAVLPCDPLPQCENDADFSDDSDTEDDISSPDEKEAVVDHGSQVADNGTVFGSEDIDVGLDGATLVAVRTPSDASESPRRANSTGHLDGINHRPGEAQTSTIADATAARTSVPLPVEELVSPVEDAGTRSYLTVAPVDYSGSDWGSWSDTDYAPTETFSSQEGDAGNVDSPTTECSTCNEPFDPQRPKP
ncbi:hypothetical protein GQ53DRAFT_833251 [Thozetella sp. PMI_491]|nr:hypothetical protein GQ53DRAFT_833251 [Thozetella sp. PMI_491]